MRAQQKQTTAVFSMGFWIELLFHALLVITPLYFRFITDELFEFNKMILVYTIATLIGGAWLARMIIEKKYYFRRSALDIPLALFAISQVLSTLFSMHPRTSLLGYYSRFHGGLLSTFVYCFLYYAVITHIEKKQLPRLFITATLSLVLVSFWAIFEHFGHSFSCLVLTGSFDVACWIQDVQNRVYASFGQPNWLAAYLITLLPLSWYRFAKKDSSQLEKSFYLLATSVGTAALLFTKSRSGIVGFAGAASIFLAGISVLAYSKFEVFKQRFSLWSIGIVVAVTISFLVLLGTPYTASLSQFVSSSNTTPTQTPEAALNRLEVGGTDSGEIRKIVWEGALAVWRRYPLFGSGLETFAYSYYLDRPTAHNLVSEWDFLYNKAHNEFLNFLATTGLVGASSYVLLLVWFSVLALKTSFAPTTRPVTERVLSLSALSGVFALSISNFFGFSTVMVSVLLCILFGVVTLLSSTTTIPIQSKTNNKKTLTGWQYFGLTITGLLMVFLGAKIHRYWMADVYFARGKSYIQAGNYQQGITSLQTAVHYSPREALFYDQLSSDLASIAVSLAAQNEATVAAQTALAATSFSDTALSLNPVHLNFYKTRARVFITLAQLEPSLLEEAKTTLELALTKAPNDPKLFYNLALVEIGLDNLPRGLELLETAVRLKPNYGVARLQLGREYLEQKNVELAREHYTAIIERIDPQNAEALEALDNLDSSRENTPAN